MPAVPTYTRPDLPDGVKPFSLLSTDMKAQELTAKTRVICINRGTEPCVMAFVLIDAKPVEVGGKTLRAEG